MAKTIRKAHGKARVSDVSSSSARVRSTRLAVRKPAVARKSAVARKPAQVRSSRSIKRESVVERKKRISSVKDAEVRFKKLVENMNEALWVGDKNERTIYANPKFRRLLKYSLSEMIGRESYDFWDQESADVVRNENKKRKKGVSSTYEGILLTKKGEPIPVLLNGTPLPDGGTMGIMTDLREIKKKEARLRESETRFRTLVENMGEALWVGDENGKSIYINSQFEKLLGYKKSDILGQEAKVFWLKDDLYILEREDEKRKQGKSSVYEGTLIHRKGYAVPVRLSGTPMPDGGTMAIISDLTETKRKEERIDQLHEYEHYLAAVTDSSADAVVGLNHKMDVKSWNKGAEKIFGFKREEIIGKSVLALYPPKKLQEGEFEKLRGEVKRKGFLKDYRTLRLDKNRKPVEVSLTLTAIKDAEGEMLGYSSIYRDMSLQRKWEEDLKREYGHLQDAYRELGRKGRQLDFFEDLLDIAMGNLEVNSIEEFVTSSAGLITKADGCALRLWDSQTKELKMKAIYGLPQEWWGKKRVKLKGSLHQRALKERKPLKIFDVSQERLYDSPRLAERYNLKSMLLIPLYLRRQPVGTLSLYLSKENKFSFLEQSFIFEFAKLAAVVLGRNRQA